MGTAASRICMAFYGGKHYPCSACRSVCGVGNYGLTTDALMGAEPRSTIQGTVDSAARNMALHKRLVIKEQGYRPER